MSNRQKYLKRLSESRVRRLKATADKYAKLPESIRAELATAAGVQNTRLDSLSGEDRRALFQACKALRKKLDRSYLHLMSSHTMLE